MASYTWNGNDAAFDDPTQWTPDGIPGIGDTATIQNGYADLVGLTISGVSLILDNEIKDGRITGLFLDNSTFDATSTIDIEASVGSTYYLSTDGTDVFAGSIEVEQPGLFAPIEVASGSLDQQAGTFVNTGSIALGEAEFDSNGAFDNEGSITIGAVDETPQSTERGLFYAYDGGFVNNGAVELAGGKIRADTPVTGDGVISLGVGDLGSPLPIGSTAQFTSSVAATQTVSFGPAGHGRLILGEASQGLLAADGSFEAHIEGFSDAGDDILIATAFMTRIDSATFADNVLTLSDGGVPLLHLNIDGNYAADAFSVGFYPGQSGYYEITEAPCFTPNTRIATPTGPQAVERLEIGDRVTLHDGTTSTVRWIGHRRAETAPLVRFAPNALRRGAPTRDLIVSDDHGIFIDGAIVPAGLLINGTSITRETRATMLYHIELEAHAILLAEGAAVESYLDTGNRRQFANCRIGYEPTEAAEGGPCADMVVGGARLAAIRATLEPVPA